MTSGSRAVNGWAETWDAPIASALESAATAVVQTAVGRWSFTPGAWLPLGATATREGEWLCLDAPADGEPSDPLASAPALLGRSTVLPGPVKYVLTDRLRLRLRAELALVDDADLAARLERALAGFRAAWACPDGSEAPAADCAASAPLVDLARLCDDAGWPYTRREPGQLMVALDVREDFVQAVLDRSPQGDVLVAVSLAATEPLLAPACVQAVAVLLLRAAGAVRMARATARQDAGPGFEVHLGPEPLADELGRALAALSVAWRLAGREADVLARDERVARQYVETVHGFDVETVRGFTVSAVPEAAKRLWQASDRAGAAGEKPAAPPKKGEDSP